MKRHAPATERNRDAIAAVLRKVLPERGLVLEVASGTGEHVVAFAAAFPSVDWQPSDADPEALTSIEAWAADACLPNLRAAITLDAAADDWPVEQADAVLSINMVHISPWRATLGLLAGAARLLASGAPLILYGPYRRAGFVTASSNEAFDESLKHRNSDWGLRKVEDVLAAASVTFTLDRLEEMPANNLAIVLRRL